MDGRAEAARAVQVFDNALGRPPFPQDPPKELIESANVVYNVIEQVVEAGKLKMMEGVAEVTTTLPVLCASLREGSPDRQPCLSLYEPLLLAVGLAAPLSTYPISHILSDAKVILGASVYGEASPSRTGQGAVNETAAAEVVAHKEATLLTFMANSRSLTPDDVRRFLRLPAQSPGVALPRQGNKKKSKGSSQGPPTPAVASSRRDTQAGVPAPKPSSVSRAVLDALIAAPLAEDCRQVFESFFDNTQKFMDVVGCDGDLASRILSIYGARIVPKLRLSSLLPCLNDALLDYYVDIVVANSQKEGLATLLSSRELRAVPLQTWDAARIHALACAVATRPVRPEEATASLFVYAFLYQIFCELEDRGSTTAEDAAISLSHTEYLFVLSVLRAVRAVREAEQRHAKEKSSSLLTYSQSKTGILLLQAADLPGWLVPLGRVAQLLLSRRIAVDLCVSGHLVELSEKLRKESAGGGEVEAVAGLVETMLCALLRAITQATPKAEQPVSSSRSQGGNSNITKEKSKASTKGDSARTKLKPNTTVSSGKVEPEAQVEAPPVPLSELLSSCCEVLLFAALLRRSVGVHNTTNTDALRNEDPHAVLPNVLCSYAYLLHHQPQRLNTVLWRSFFSLFTYFTWMHTLMSSRDPSVSGDVASQTQPFSASPTDALADVLTSATASTDFMLWLSPFVLTANNAMAARTSNSISALLCARSDLCLAVVQAAVNTQCVASPPLMARYLSKQLYPASPAYVLGSLCCAVDEAALQALADGVVSSTSSRSMVLLSSLQRMHRDANWEGASCHVQSCFLSSCVPVDAVRAALGRLVEVMEILQAGHRAVHDAAEAEAKEAAQRAMVEQLHRSSQLAAAHRYFIAETQSKQAAKAAEHAMVQAEAARRRAQAAARLRDDAAARARKRLNALETLRQKAEQTAAHREAARLSRFAAYQKRLQSEYRVSTFLEHLNLSSARVMETRDALRKVIDTITPDDLLEFLVSGEPKVPADMMDDRAGDAEDMMVEAAPTEKEAATPSMTGAPPAPRYTGERRDFWAEIMDNAVPVEPVKPTPSSANAEAAVLREKLSGTPSTGYRRQSFHRRVSPFLDLFFYEDGDEYGNVPDTLPSIRLRLAASVWPPAKTQLLGFDDLRDAFNRMQQRGLVQVDNGVVQLTLLGFRYHFPFHNPDGMLEVYLREARERVRAVVAQRENKDGLATGEPSDGGSGGEEWEEEQEEEEDDEENENADRLLPEVEFGI